MANFNTGLTKQQIITALTKALESMSEQEVQSAISTAVSGKQDILSFDNTPTSGSSNPVTSDGIHDDQQRQETEIGAVAALGAKNLLNPDDYKVNSSGGLTVTSTGSGTYKVTGTPSGTVDIFATASAVYDRMYGLQVGKTYTISGLPTGNGLLCRIDVARGGASAWSGQIVSNLTLPQTFTVPNDATGLYIRYRITTSASIPTGGIELNPMIRLAEITDDTFVPYAPTNRELYEMILSLQSGVSAQSAASLMQAGRIDADLMDDTDNDVSETSGGEEMR